jgi:hypothetical protein
MSITVRCPPGTSGLEDAHLLLIEDRVNFISLEVVIGKHNTTAGTNLLNVWAVKAYVHGELQNWTSSIKKTSNQGVYKLPDASN